MHDAHLGRVFLFLDILAEDALLSMTVTATPCLWYVVGVKLVMSYVKFPQAPFTRALFGNCRLERMKKTIPPRTQKTLSLEMFIPGLKISVSLEIFNPGPCFSAARAGARIAKPFSIEKFILH